MSRRPLFPPVFEPTVSRPLVDDFSIRAARQQSRQQPAVALTYELPLRNHPLWTGNNSLGFELDLEQDVSSTTVLNRTVIKLDEWGMPDVWTVALSTNFVVPGTIDPAAFQLEGEIEFGAGGAVDTVRFDWVTGTVMRLPMNALSVKVFGIIGTPVGGPDATVPPDLRVRVILAKGPLDGLPPQSTRQMLGIFGSLAPWTVSAPVPRYAKSFIPFGANQASADLLFAATNYYVFYVNNPGIAGTAQVIGMLRAQDALQYMGGEGIPIPAPARRVGFINGVGGTLNANLVFNLCL